MEGSSILLTKRFGAPARPQHGYPQGAAEDKVDGLLQHLANRDVPSLRYFGGQFVPDFREPVEVAPSINCAVADLHESNGEVAAVTLKLSSATLPSTKLRLFLDDCYSKYRMNVQDQLGSNLFVFQQSTFDPELRGGGGGGVPGVKIQAPPNLRFSRHRFQTTRTLDTVFHERMATVKRRLYHFMDHEDWYKRKGVPHTFGLLLHGVAGAGKTSLIKVRSAPARLSAPVGTGDLARVLGSAHEAPGVPAPSDVREHRPGAGVVAEVDRPRAPARQRLPPDAGGDPLDGLPAPLRGSGHLF